MEQLDKEVIDELSEPAKRVFRSLDYRSQRRMLKKESFTGDYADWTKTLIYLCEMTFTIALTVGSVKGAQSLTSKALGL